MLQELSQDVNPKAICRKIGLCTTKVHRMRPSQAAGDLKKKHSEPNKERHSVTLHDAQENTVTRSEGLYVRPCLLVCQHEDSKEMWSCGALQKPCMEKPVHDLHQEINNRLKNGVRRNH
uniref:Saposin B type region 2 domain-containing protein n=1 Tax=Pinctada fucata TaxID=50426 RepID=A0A194ANI7_PINFU